MASWNTPSRASKDRSCAVAVSGSDIGSVTSADSSAPSSTAGSMSGVRTDGWHAWRCCRYCSKVQLMAPAIGTPSATSAPVIEPPPLRACWPNIQAMPAPATPMASQVRAGRR